MKHSFFQAAVMSILLYGCTTWTLTKRMEKKLDDNYTRMLRAILNKSWRQHPTKQQLYAHLPPITKTIQVRRTRHTGHYWRSRDELISDVLLWTPSHGRAKAGRLAQTYCSSHRFSLENQCPRQAIRPHTDQSGAKRIGSIYLSRTFSFSPFWKSTQSESTRPAAKKDLSLSRPLLRTFQHGRSSLKIRGYFQTATQTNQPRGLSHELSATVTHLLQTEDNVLPATSKRNFSHSD